MLKIKIISVLLFVNYIEKVLKKNTNTWVLGRVLQGLVCHGKTYIVLKDQGYPFFN